MLALYPLWRKARRVYSLTSRLPGTNRLGFQPSLALSEGLRLTADVLDVDADATGSLTNGAAQKIGAQYKFKNGLTLAGHYEDVTELKLGTNIWAHASYKVGKHGLVTASYGINEGDPSDNVYTSDTKGDAATWSIGGKYMLTKNSALIVGFNDHDRDGGDDAQTFTVGIDAKFGY
ncbi:MAG: porin [Candidatus Thiodiazotropha sp. L084R]